MSSGGHAVCPGNSVDVSATAKRTALTRAAGAAVGRPGVTLAARSVRSACPLQLPKQVTGSVARTD
eukprot:363264-Chlamydomonas_euryale.AAC.7